MTNPRTDILSVGFADQKFKLFERQEYSRSSNGVTRGKSFGSALWTAEWTTLSLPHDDALDYEARLNALDGVINEFYAYDLRRPYPRAHADGNFSDTGQVNSIGSDGKSLSVKSLAGGFILSRGDYLAFDYSQSRGLHQVMETVTASGAGVTPEFEVRPHLRPGLALSATVVLKQPSARFVLLPGSVEHSIQGPLHTVVSFRAVQSI